MNYLHESNVYHGAIRPFSFEVFKNQRVKISDFTMAIKMREDSAKNSEREVYQLKSLPYLYSEELKRKYQGNGKFSRKQLVEADRFALLQSFEQAMDDVKIFTHTLDKKQ